MAVMQDPLALFNNPNNDPVGNYMAAYKQGAEVKQQQATQARNTVVQGREDQQYNHEQALQSLDAIGGALDQVQPGDAQGFEAVKQSLVQKGLIDPATAAKYSINDLPQIRALSQQARAMAAQHRAEAQQTFTNDLATKNLGVDQSRNAETRRHNMAEEGIASDKAKATAQLDPALVQKIANYEVDLSPRDPAYKTYMAAASAQNPSFNSGEFKLRSSARQAFNIGRQGDTVRSLNVAVAHLSTLSDLADALQNGNVQSVNSIGQHLQEQFGDAAPTNFDAAKAIVADEVAKAVIGGQNAQSDRENLQARLSRAGSPDQLKGVIDKLQTLMGGQLGGLRRQYQHSTKATDFDESFLSPETRATLGASENAQDKAPGGGPIKWKMDASGNLVKVP